VKCEEPKEYLKKREEGPRRLSTLCPKEEAFERLKIKQGHRKKSKSRWKPG